MEGKYIEKDGTMLRRRPSNHFRDGWMLVTLKYYHNASTIYAGGVPAYSYEVEGSSCEAGPIGQSSWELSPRLWYSMEVDAPTSCVGNG